MTATSRTRAPRSDAAHNREALLDAARLLLNRDPAAPLDAIAHAAGLSRRSVYSHFASRDELIVALTERGAARIAAALDRVADPDPVVETALLGRVAWDEVEHTHAMTQVALHEPFRSRIRPSLDAMHQRLERTVARAATAGSARTDLPSDFVARLIAAAAFTVLEEAARTPLDSRTGRRLVILAGLGAMGLSWREAGAVLQANAAVLGLEAAE
ncbi:TetR/AcrR family transcriptional regulator [uncultured Amnibacterium sp.]|uniref:TetR/AcrR family transcriptional regulator n=1 Tax=uncultured Amnibacterium sp. TaxID=1631851 RepID=UPI0035CAEEA0